MKHVIVGNSFAGIFAAEAIRSVDIAEEIVIISDETQRLYSRALIHEYLAGLIDESKMFLRDDDIYQDQRIKLLDGRRATELKADDHELIVDGEAIKYDKLLLAVGGAPFIPPGIDGLDEFKDSISTFTLFSDAQQLIEKSKDIKHVVVLGAGLIGMQAADAFAHLGKDVRVIELADHILPLAEGLSEKLTQGIDVLDIGCGSGRQLT